MGRTSLREAAGAFSSREAAAWAALLAVADRRGIFNIADDALTSAA
jgi:hypothetical protein